MGSTREVALISGDYCERNLKVGGGPTLIHPVSVGALSAYTLSSTSISVMVHQVIAGAEDDLSLQWLMPV